MSDRPRRRTTWRRVRGWLVWVLLPTVLLIYCVWIFVDQLT
jgi:Na+/melibiose symporter-like transporter